MRDLWTKIAGAFRYLYTHRRVFGLILLTCAISLSIGVGMGFWLDEEAPPPPPVVLPYDHEAVKLAQQMIRDKDSRIKQLNGQIATISSAIETKKSQLDWLEAAFKVERAKVKKLELKVASLKQTAADSLDAMSKTLKQNRRLEKEVSELQDALYLWKERAEEAELEMLTVLNREEKNWGSMVRAQVVYDNIYCTPGQVFKLQRIGRFSDAAIELPVAIGRHPSIKFDSRVQLVPSGIYRISLWKDGQFVKESVRYRAITQTPHRQTVTSPDGTEFTISPKNGVNMIVFTGGGNKVKD